ncbi:MAG: glutaredoxin [Cycloclasticus sp. symbiont of Bathymodiolus heckerae]|nr:MAG: glutaredoxin [Cycloclasticus sp. symbiont of Bathymodiolus heckerae]
MSDIIIYTSSFCPYCIQAKRLLNKKNISFVEINISKEPVKRVEMMQKSQQRTVPQIFNGDSHIGDCMQIYAFEQDGKLDELLA